MASRHGRRWTGPASLAALTLAPPFASAAQRAVIPFEISELQHMVVALEINDTARTTGVVDTAATFAMVDSRAAKDSGVPLPGPQSRLVSILGVNGTRTYPVVHIDSVDAGPLRVTALDAACSQDASVPGSAANIFPVAAFPGDVIEFDFAARTITAYDGRPERTRSRDTDPLAYTIEGGLIFVDVKINGYKGRALIDTGSNLSYVNSAVAGRAHLRRDEERTTQLLGITGDSAKFRVASAHKAGLAEFKFENPKLSVSDPVLLSELGLAGEPVMLIGLDFLTSFRMQFDRQSSWLVLSLPRGNNAGVELGLQARSSRLADRRRGTRQ